MHMGVGVWVELRNPFKNNMSCRTDREGSRNFILRVQSERNHYSRSRSRIYKIAQIRKFCSLSGIRAHGCLFPYLAHIWGDVSARALMLLLDTSCPYAYTCQSIFDIIYFSVGHSTIYDIHNFIDTL